MEDEFLLSLLLTVIVASSSMGVHSFSISNSQPLRARSLCRIIPCHPRSIPHSVVACLPDQRVANFAMTSSTLLGSYISSHWNNTTGAFSSIASHLHASIKTTSSYYTLDSPLSTLSHWTKDTLQPTLPGNISVSLTTSASGPQKNNTIAIDTSFPVTLPPVFLMAPEGSGTTDCVFIRT
jgi:hypothetical protein